MAAQVLSALCVFVLAAFLEAALARCSPVGMQSFLARARNQLARPVEFLSIPNMCMGANSAKAFSLPSFTTRSLPNPLNI